MNSSIQTPYLTPKAFARALNGGVDAAEDSDGLITERAVLEMCKKGELPVKPRKSGQRYFINVALLHKQATERDF